MKLFYSSFILFITFLMGCSNLQTGYNNRVIKIVGRKDYPPISWSENGIKKGIGIRLGEDIFNKLGLDYKIILVDDWDQAINDLKDGKYDFALGANKSNKRQDNLLYGNSYHWDPAIIFYPKGHRFQVYTLLDLHAKKGGIVKGDHWGEILGESGQHELVISKDNLKNQLIKLSKKKLDYVIVANFPGMLKLVELRLENKIDYNYFNLAENQIYFVASKKSPFRTIIFDANEYIDQYIRNGLFNNMTNEVLMENGLLEKLKKKQ